MGEKFATIFMVASESKSVQFQHIYKTLLNFNPCTETMSKLCFKHYT